MFTRIQTRSFRCLKSVDQTLGSFRALVGPNASGKTTFLDVIGLMGDLVKNRGGVLETIAIRSSSFEKLLWMGQGNSFQLAVEAAIPENIHKIIAKDKQRFTSVRYEVEVGLDLKSNEIGLNYENLWLKESEIKTTRLQRDLFPAPQETSSSLISRSMQKGQRAALTKKPGGNDNYYTEGKKSYMPSFKLGRSALGFVDCLKKVFKPLF
jgi:predicted ATPase